MKRSTRVKLRYWRSQISASWSNIKMLPECFRNHFYEVRLTRDIAYVTGPTCVQDIVEPIPHNAHWDAVKKAYKAANEPLAEACQRTVEAVAEALEGPKAANVTRLRSKERK